MLGTEFDLGKGRNNREDDMGAVRIAVFGMLAAGLALAAAPASAQAQTLDVRVDGFKNGGVIPNQYGFCIAANQGHVAPGPDKSPEISWSKGPNGTKSYVITLTDIDNAAEQREKINKEGMTVSASAGRRTVFHWLLVDIPSYVTSLPEGAESEGRVPHGKPQTPAAVGVRGLNAFTDFMAGNEQMKGQWFGYDGPCPPWNDEIAHHFVFTVYALRVESLNLSGAFDGSAAIAALTGKVLAKGELVGLFSTNPEVIGKLPR
jgi:Raf kinase inhibitor-like YbhB/YbcL family protein